MTENKPMRLKKSLKAQTIRDTITVVKPTPGGPSDIVGIKSGDKIIKVEEETVAGVEIDTRGVTDRLLGKKGTQVKISVIHLCL